MHKRGAEKQVFGCEPGTTLEADDPEECSIWSWNSFPEYQEQLKPDNQEQMAAEGLTQPAHSTSRVQRRRRVLLCKNAHKHPGMRLTKKKRDTVAEDKLHRSVSIMSAVSTEKLRLVLVGKSCEIRILFSRHKFVYHGRPNMLITRLAL